ncbi:MAG: hypothetical protein ABIE74_12755 [Pseudomonadota bacterium]
MKRDNTDGTYSISIRKDDDNSDLINIDRLEHEQAMRYRSKAIERYNIKNPNEHRLDHVIHEDLIFWVMIS